VGGCVVICDKAQRTRKWALWWAQYRRRDSNNVGTGEPSDMLCPLKIHILLLEIVNFPRKIITSPLKITSPITHTG